jgi:hypothetical protein
VESIKDWDILLRLSGEVIVVHRVGYLDCGFILREEPAYRI